MIQHMTYVYFTHTHTVIPLPLDFPHPLPGHPLFPYMVDFLRHTASPATPADPPPPPPLPPRLPPRNIPRKSDEETPQHSEPSKKKPAFYLRLSLQTLSCLSSGLLCSQNSRVSEFVRKKLSAEHMSCFAWLLRSVTNDQLQSELLEMLHSLVMRGMIGDGLQGLLLRELELNTKCWPLQVCVVCRCVVCAGVWCVCCLRGCELLMVNFNTILSSRSLLFIFTVGPTERPLIHRLFNVLLVELMMNSIFATLDAYDDYPPRSLKLQ